MLADRDVAVERGGGEEREGGWTGKAKYARAGPRGIPLFRAYHKGEKNRR